MALERIGPYKIQGILGRGGMGTVYRGVNLENNSVDAIKVLAPNFADDPHFRGRFESEIKALLKLNHPNIVKLLSFGQEEGMLFFAMELVEGYSLFQMQKQKHPFDWRQVIAIAKDCAAGLRHAHDRGVIHRDLKPGNLLMAVDDQGQPDHVKLTDFGIAKRFGNSQNTGTNILGTMDFMSPEQAKGEPVTVRSDLYSLGTVMFTLLSGRPPFTSNSVEESLRNLTRVPAPRISSVQPDVPRELDALISQLMAKKPEERIPTALALSHKLNALEEHLRDAAEAQTAQRQGPAGKGTFEVAAPATREDTQFEAPSSIVGAAPTQRNEDPDATALLTEDPISLAPEAPSTNVNFYNTVTDQIREHQATPEPIAPETKSGILPLTLALLTVLALAAYGVYASTRPPSAESLYSTIADNSGQPQRVITEIDQFIEFYPDEPRIEQVKRMRRIGEAIRNFQSMVNTLKVRSRTPSGLNEMEKQFMDIVQLAEDDPDGARKKMQAFVTFHSGQAELSEREHQCIAAATGFPVKLEHEKRTAILENLGRLRTAMNRANTEPDKPKAIELYQSILQLYGDVEWGMIRQEQESRQLLEKAKTRILELRQAIEQERLEAAAAPPPDEDDEAPREPEAK